MTRPYHIHINAGPLAGKVLRVLAHDELDAAGMVGRELREHALNTGPAIYAPEPGVDLFGKIPAPVPTITLREAREALKADAS